MGPSPWEGTLSPANHAVFTTGARGVSLPAKAVEVKGQTTLMRVRTLPAAATVTVRAEPPSASILVNDVPIAKGVWEGVLPIGTQRIIVQEEGYFSQERTLQLTETGAARQQIEIRLPIDEDHPRWPRPPKAKLWAGPWGGFGVGPSLSSGPEARCPEACSADPLALGLIGGVRVGFELPFPLSIELTAGYVTLWRKIERSVTGGFPLGAPVYEVDYELTDMLRLRGPFVGGGVSYGSVLTEHLTLRTRLTAGVVLASSYDTLTGTASLGNEQRDVGVAGAGGSASSRPLFMMPEIGVETDVSGWALGGALGVLFLPGTGPSLPHDSITVSSDGCDLDHPGALGCAPVYEAIADERAYGPFWMLVPQVSARYAF